MKRINFSIAYALLGPFGYFFHRNQVRKDIPFWKCAGLDLFAITFIGGFLLRIILVILSIDPSKFSIAQAAAYDIIIAVSWGFVGAWHFKRYMREDINTEADKEIWKRRELYSLFTGSVVWLVIHAVALLENPAFADNVQKNYETQNGYICEKYFEVNQSYQIFETNDQIRNAIKEIHSFCPSDLATKDTVSLEEIERIMPQLVGYDFSKDFIHSYVTVDSNIAYIYIRKIK